MTFALESPRDRTLQDDINAVCAQQLPWEKLFNTTILITGASGLVGSYFVRTLMAANRIHGCQIRILAMVRSGEKAKMVFGELTQRPELCIIQADIMEAVQIDEPIDYIVHTASVTASKEFVTHPVETIDIAFLGTKNILELARKKKCLSVVYVSSMEVYGTVDSADNQRIKEDRLGFVDLSKVRSCYPEGKRICENMCVCYAAEYGVPVKIARLAQTFGAGTSLHDSRVFVQFAKAAMEEDDIVLHTKGASNGNYCYIADTAAGLLTILLLGSIGEAYNVVSEVATTTIAEMAQMISDRITGGKSRVVFDIPQNALIYGYAPEVKLRLSGKKLEALGWKPSIAPDLETMYNRLIASLSTQLNISE